MNGLAACQAYNDSIPLRGLLLEAFQEHLDAPCLLVVACQVAKGVQIEIRRQRIVEMPQHVQVELRGDPGRIVVRRFQHRLVFLAIDADL